MIRLAILILILACSLSAYGYAEQAVAVEEVGIAYQGEGRDPFLPLIGPDGSVKFSFDATDITIEGIVYDPVQGSMVLANGEFYREGDTVGNSNVISILKDRVILEQESEQKTMWIREETIKEQ